jgi:hypothetical protein
MTLWAMNARMITTTIRISIPSASFPRTSGDGRFDFFG